MATIRKDICMIPERYLNNTSVYLPASGTLGITRFHPEYFNPIDAIYFEVSAQVANVDMDPYVDYPYCQIILYDNTSASVVWNSGELSGSSFRRIRSSDIKASLTADADLIVQCKAVRQGTGGGIVLISARLIIIQTPPILATATYFMIGDNLQTKATSATECPKQKRMYFDADRYDGTIDYDFQATLRATATMTTYAELYDVTNSAIVTTISTTEVTNTLVEETPLENTPTDNSILTVRYYCSSAGFLYIRNAHFIVKQTGTITKTQNAHHIFAGESNETSTSYDSTERYESAYDPAEYAAATRVLDCDASLKCSTAADPVYHKLMTGTTTITNSEQTTSSTSYARFTSANLTEPSSDDISMDMYVTTVGNNAYVASSRILVYMTAMETGGTNCQINIGDSWKAVDAMQINIGDSWKAVAGMQINIGDAWKTIF